jgi:hypothetical protein
VLLEQAFADLDGGMIELVWDAIDMFKQSIFMTRERDLESEAINSARIGELFNKCLKYRVLRLTRGIARRASGSSPRRRSPNDSQLTTTPSRASDMAIC